MCAPYSRDTLRLSGCHVTSGINGAEGKDRVSQFQYVSYTQVTKSPVTIQVRLYTTKPAAITF